MSWNSMVATGGVAVVVLAGSTAVPTLRAGRVADSPAIWVTVASAGYHSCAIRTAGTLWCWGTDPGGLFGAGLGTAHPAPDQIGGERTWTGIAAGADHSCGTTTGGTMWC